MQGKSGQQLLDVLSHPDTPMSVRLRLQESIIEPLYERFYEEDVAEKRDQEKQSDASGENGQGQQGEESESGEEKSEAQDESSAEGESHDASPADPKGKNEEQSQGYSEQGGSDRGEVSDQNGEDYFREEYDDFERRMKHAVSDEALEEAVAEEVARQKQEEEKRQNSDEELLRAYAEAQGVDIGDLKRYQRHREQLESLTHPETGEGIIEELRAIFRRIITKRKRRVIAPQYPVDEGDILAYPSEAVVRTRSGETEIDVWETTEWREKEDKLVGDFDVTLIGDISGSMDQAGKASQQRLAITLLLEALTEFADDLEVEEATLKESLSVRTECLVFATDKEKVKTLSTTLTEKERIGVYKRLESCDGSSTKDFLALESVLGNLTDEEREKMERGKLKKIVLVMTDGQSDDATRVQRTLVQMREQGVVVVGIGITSAGQSVMTTYAPEAEVVAEPSDLPRVLANLLEEHLKNL
jgi:hypothetical protein